MLAKLEKFKQSISAKPFTSSSEPGDNEEEEDVSDWKKVKLKFAPGSGKVKSLKVPSHLSEVLMDVVLH